MIRLTRNRGPTMRSPPLGCRSVRTRQALCGNVGFTLIELLVVVSIIALLIAILLPSLKKARDQAKNTKCLSNLHQIGISCSAYAADNRKGVYPSWYTIGGSSFRVLPKMVTEYAGSKPETLGLAAVFDRERIMPAGGNKVWLCPLNTFDAKYGNTYWVNCSDPFTQNPLRYKPGTVSLYITDNWNLKPYPSGKRRDDLDALGQGLNTGYFRTPTYFHRGRSSRWQEGQGGSSIKGYGRGINVLHLDLNAGFLALE